MGDIDSSKFVGRWQYVPDAEGDANFYEFLKLSGLSQCPVGTKVIVELSDNGSGNWLQHDTFGEVNENEFSFKPNVAEGRTLDDGTIVSSFMKIEGSVWNYEKTQGDISYNKTYTFDGDDMKASYSFASATAGITAFAAFKRQA